MVDGNDMTQEGEMLEFERAFHRTAERHERVWIFTTVSMLSLLTLGTLFYAVHDYGLVTTAAEIRTNPVELANEDEFRSGKLVQTGPKAYSAYLTGHIWSWTPSPIHVKKGSTVTFHVTSSDVLHGFEVKGTPINLTAVPGMVGTVTYTFNTVGTFHVVCNEYCGLEHQAMVGKIIVDPEERT